MENSKVFANGFIFKRSENAPNWVIGKLSISVNDAKAFIDQHSKNGWVNLNINQNQNGKYYIELDTFDPKAQSDKRLSNPMVTSKSIDYGQKNKPYQADVNDDDLPF